MTLIAELFTKLAITTWDAIGYSGDSILNIGRFSRY